MSSFTPRATELYETGRTYLERLLPKLKEADLHKKLHPESNSVAFLLRHMAEVEFAHARTFYGRELPIKPTTLGPRITDEGQGGTELQPLLDLLAASRQNMLDAINSIADDAQWDEKVESYLGPIPRRNALARIIAHNAYHGGQLAMVLKYAEVPVAA